MKKHVIVTNIEIKNTIIIIVYSEDAKIKEQHPVTKVNTTLQNVTLKLHGNIEDNCATRKSIRATYSDVHSGRYCTGR